MISCAYYQDGSLKSLTDVSGKTLYYGYDGTGRLADLKDEDGTTLTEYEYTTAGRIKEIRTSDGAAASYTYDSDGNISRLRIENTERNEILYDSFMLYDLNGNRISKTGKAYNETGHLMSESTRTLYLETGDLDAAYAQSASVHDNWLEIWGNENDYVQAHAEFGTELSQEFGLDRTFMSVTTDPDVARRFANTNGRVFEAYIPKSQLIEQTLSGAGESEFLIKLGSGGFK